MIGTKVMLNGVSTAEEALDLTGANYIVEPHELVTNTGINVDSNKAMVRTDTMKSIGVVGNRYTPLQNNVVFSMFDVLCRSYGAQFDYGYVIDGGSKVILQAKLDGTALIRKGDECFRYINIMNSFDGSTPFIAAFTFLRLVCTNRLVGLKKESMVVVRHTKNAESRTQEALRILGIGQSYFKQFEAQCQQLAQKMMTKEMVESFLKQMVGEETSTRKKNIWKTITELYEGDGMGTGQGTAWDMYNAYTEWVDHHRTKNEEKQVANAILGGNAVKEAAYKTILSL